VACQIARIQLKYAEGQHRTFDSRYPSSILYRCIAQRKIDCSDEALAAAEIADANFSLGVSAFFGGLWLNKGRWTTRWAAPSERGNGGRSGVALSEHFSGHFDHFAGIADVSGDRKGGAEAAAGMVGVASIGKAAGRIFWAWVSDAISRRWTFVTMFLIQASLIWHCQAFLR
jgi:hypothetical protein